MIKNQQIICQFTTQQIICQFTVHTNHTSFVSSQFTQITVHKSMEVQFSTEKAQRDYSLVCAAREKGDQKAFAELMQFYREPLYLMLLKMTKNAIEADDLTIETFGKAFCSLHLYTPSHAFSTWLFSIASNNCIDHIRRKRMQTISLNAISTEENEFYEYPLPSDLPSPEEEFMSTQRKELIHEMVKLLKPRYRDMIQMRYFEELSYEEIAEKMNLPMGTVKVQLLRARNQLAEILKSKKGQF